MIKVGVGSQNPVKVNCVKKAFTVCWPKKKFVFVSQSVSSGVNDQPRSDEECVLGAKNRAEQVLKETKANFGVGIEGGIVKMGEHFFARAWVVVIDNKGNTGLASSVSAPMSKRHMDLINSGIELGKADDMITGRKNTKQKEGYFGFISSKLITREKGYIDAVIMALARFKKLKLFSQN